MLHSDFVDLPNSNAKTMHELLQNIVFSPFDVHFHEDLITPMVISNNGNICATQPINLIARHNDTKTQRTAINSSWNLIFHIDDTEIPNSLKP